MGPAGTVISDRGQSVHGAGSRDDAGAGVGDLRLADRVDAGHRRLHLGRVEDFLQATAAGRIELLGIDGMDEAAPGSTRDG